MCVFKPRRDEASAAGSKSCVEWRLASPPHRAVYFEQEKEPFTLFHNNMEESMNGINILICSPRMECHRVSNRAVTTNAE